MNCKIPFTKDIELARKIYEITSISLEHEIKVQDGALNGNFIVSGDFKSHEVSVNKEAFSYVLPFVIDIQDDVDPDTIEFMIDDFTYEIIDNSSLRVNIDFSIIASKKEIIEEKIETLFEDASTVLPEKEEREEEKIEEQEIKEEKISNVEKEEIIKKEEEKTEEKEEIPEIKENEENKTDKDRAILGINSALKEEEPKGEDTIINNIKDKDDEYTTYHIHMVNDGETIETICTMYNSNINILGEYNDINNISSKDKIIIPEKDE